MGPKNEKSKIFIKTGNNEDILELQLCANEFIDFIDDFKLNLQSKKYLILTAYYFKTLSGILLADNKGSKVDKLESIVPKVQLIFLFVNPAYRNKEIASCLLRSFIKIHKRKNTATIFINLPRKYKIGKKFFENFNFIQTKISNNNVVLERNLWYDFGIKTSDYIKDRNNIKLNDSWV